MILRASALLTALLFLLAAAPPLPAAAARDGDYSQVDTYIRDSMAATGAPGVAYAVVGPEDVDHVGAFGRDGNGEPVTAATPFLWGSVSKPVTATAVLSLVETGDLELDEPVRAYLPGFALANEEAAARITIRHLLEQTSGIPDGTGITDRFDDISDPYADAVADLAGVTPIADPGKQHEYSSANYLVLGAAVEAVTGQPFADFLHDSVLDPLEMTAPITSPEQAAASLPPGHRIVFGQPARYDSPYDPTGPSYGYLGGAVTDLAHFAVSQLGGGSFQGARVLSEESTELAHTGRAYISDTHTYGLGWRDDARNADLGTRTIWHGGAVPGYHAMVVLLPEAECGIVVLHNTYSVLQDFQVVAVGLGAARLLAGGDAEPPPKDSDYTAPLAALAAATAAILAGIAWAVHRLRRPGRPRGRARIAAAAAAWALGCAGVAYAAGIAAPASADITLGELTFWAPDLGGLLAAITAGAAVLGVLRVLIALRVRRGSS